MRLVDPFRSLDQMLSPFESGWRGGVMPMDAFEQDGVYTLRFDLPGVNPEDVDLTVEDRVLTVTAERPVEKTEDVTWLLRERPAGNHRREVRLGSRLDASAIAASYDNGVLTVSIPMAEEARPQKISISSQPAEKMIAGVSG